MPIPRVDPTERLRPRTGAVLGVVILGGIASIPASAFVVGQQGEPDGHDVMIEPLAMSRAVAVVLGVVALVVVVLAVGVLTQWLVRREIDRRWALAAAWLFGAGVAMGCGYRIVTAYVTGANIGGGLVVLVGGPTVIALVTLGLVVVSRIVLDDQRARTVEAAS